MSALPPTDGSATPITIMWAGMGVPCPVPVTPGGSIDAPLSERTETCGANAQWWMGAQAACEAHMSMACGLAGIDFDGVKREATDANA